MLCATWTTMRDTKQSTRILKYTVYAGILIGDSSIHIQVRQDKRTTDRTPRNGRLLRFLNSFIRPNCAPSHPFPTTEHSSLKAFLCKNGDSFQGALAPLSVCAAACFDMVFNALPSLNHAIWLSLKVCCSVASQTFPFLGCTLKVKGLPTANCVHITSTLSSGLILS